MDRMRQGLAAAASSARDGGAGGGSFSSRANAAGGRQAGEAGGAAGGGAGGLLSGKAGERSRCQPPLQLKSFRAVVERAKGPINPNQLVFNLKDSKNAAGIVREVALHLGWRESSGVSEDCNANLYWYERAISVGEVRACVRACVRVCACVCVCV